VINGYIFVFKYSKYPTLLNTKNVTTMGYGLVTICQDLALKLLFITVYSLDLTLGYGESSRYFVPRNTLNIKLGLGKSSGYFYITG
jgi:hypothetical protein